MSQAPAKTGILLINLGTPQAPTPEAVGRYLKEFLMDPYVIDIAYPWRWFLVNVAIVPRRSKDSANLYQKVWRTDGSPLLVHHLALSEKMRRTFGADFVVRAGMRYGEPSLLSAMTELKAASVSRLIVCPLYPQYSEAATRSSVEKVEEGLRRLRWAPKVSVLPPFYDDSDYLDAVAKVSAPILQGKPYDMALFSFHGLPERQVKKTDSTGEHCLAKESCCDRVEEANQYCYRAHCYATAKRLAVRLGIPETKYRVCFQSRLGRTPWIRPYTDEYYRTLPAQGVKRLAVLCPSFVADCLETLEEVSLRGREEFIQNGGEELFLVPSLNESDIWVDALTKMTKRCVDNFPSLHQAPDHHSPRCPNEEH